ncbi:MAG: hypothetical protein MUD01_26230, partial [Chloroflexaceae bacterium]|nr:hypothetical protein [Chloroflexaceae bacterium]
MTTSHPELGNLIAQFLPNWRALLIVQGIITTVFVICLTIFIVSGSFEIGFGAFHQKTGLIIDKGYIFNIHFIQDNACDRLDLLFGFFL